MHNLKINVIHYLARTKLWLLLSLAIILLDQISKFLMLHYLRDTLSILPFLNFIVSFNSGAAFGFLNGKIGWQVLFLSIVAVVVIACLLIWLGRLRTEESWTALALSLIIGGAAGNLIGRLHLFYVVDFIDFHLGQWHFATFNVADSAICIGASLLAIAMIKQALFPFLSCQRKLASREKNSDL